MKSAIYQIKNQINGKHYIGSAVNLRRRIQNHLSALRHNTHPNPHLQAAFDKHGEAAFVFSVLEDVEPQALIEREQHYFDTMHPEYNILPIAGSSLGCHRSSEFRRKISEANKGKQLSKEHRKKLSEAARGKHPSMETRRKLSEAHRGKRHSKETRRKMSIARKGERNPLYGKPLSEETKRKMRIARIGRTLSAEHRRKIGETLKGRYLSEETRRKIGAAHKGRKLSEEHKQKISEALSGERHPNYGRHHSKETHAKMSEARKAYWQSPRNPRTDERGG